MTQETWFDLWLRRMRLGRVLNHIPKDSTLVDIGCGHDAKLLMALKNHLREGIGIDFKVEAQSAENIALKKMTLADKVPLDDGMADVVTMLAVLEHVKQPQEMMIEAYRILKTGGIFLATTPTPRSRPILEFLSFKLNLVDPLEILDHKRYLWGFELYNMLKHAGFRHVEWHEFQLGCNTFVKAVK